MTRARRMIEALIDANKPLSLAEVIAAIDDGTVPLEKLGPRVSAQLAIFVAARRAKRTGVLGHYRFAPTKSALIDRRLKPATVKSTARKRRQADKAAPIASPPQQPGSRLVLTRPPEVIAPAKLSVRDRLAADVDAFLARGGKIARLSPGECAKPTQAWLEANGLAKPRKPRKSTTSNDDVDIDDVA